MTGSYAHNIDAKGRLFIPSKLREELGNTFHAAIGACKGTDGQAEHYLTLYPEPVWQALCARVAALPSTQSAAADVFFANAADCEPDAQGRVLLPQKLRAYAGLTKAVVIVGNNDKAKVWDAELWKRKESAALMPDAVLGMMESLGI